MALQDKKYRENNGFPKYEHKFFLIKKLAEQAWQYIKIDRQMIDRQIDRQIDRYGTVGKKMVARFSI